MTFNLDKHIYSVPKLSKIDLTNKRSPIGESYTPINPNLEGVTEFLYNTENFIKYGEIPGNVRISEYCNELRTLTIFINHSLSQAMICKYCPPPPKRIPRPWKN